MSLKIFLLNTFGGIKSTTKIEAVKESLREDYQVFTTVDQSEELVTFLALEEKINSETFKKMKAELKALTFKNSSEQNQLKQFNKLKKNRRLKKYYQTAASPELKRYESLKEGTQLDRYFELAKIVQQGETKSEKKVKKLKAEFSSLKSSPDVRLFQKFPKTSAYKNFLRMHNSEEKIKYEELLKSKDDLEKAQLKQFNKLKKNKRLRKYYETANSSELKRYEDLKSGDQLNRYFELEKLIPQELRNSAAEAKELRAEYKTLKSSSDVRLFHKYPKSSAFRNYLSTQESEEKRKYEELKKIIASDEFKERKAYLEDNQKWEKTPEFKAGQQYVELKNKPDLILYFKYKNSDVFDFLKNWKVVFEDCFELNSLDTSKWKTINYWAEKTVGKNFSQDGDLQAFADGENTHLKGSQLQIQVKKDKINSMVWKPALGFVEQEFDYSSDTLTTGGLFQAQYGIIEAKVKYDPNKNFQDVFYLAGEDSAVRVNLLEAGAKSQVGLSKSVTGKVAAQAFSLSGLSAGKFYIFRVEWEKGKICWKINNKELFTVQSDVPDYPMHLNLASFIIRESNNLPHNFEIDWIRFYQKRK